MHGRGLLLAVPIALVAQPARGDHQLADDALQVLSLIDRQPTVHELVRVFGPDPTLALIHVATDPAQDLGIRLRAIGALPQFCPTPCAGTLIHSALRGLVTGPATDGRAILLLRAALEALGDSRSGDSSDVSVIIPYLGHSSRDLRASAAYALRVMCNTQAISPLRARYDIETVDQVRVAISTALRDLAGCAQ